jgi:hypothetical protein
MLPSLYASGRVLPIITRGGWKAAVARLGAAVLLAAGLTVVTGGVSQAGVLHCGDVITANTRLTSDLVNCPDNGIVIGADNITLDLNGHVIDGDGTPVPSCPPATACDTGVDNTAGHSHVTIKGGSIRQFDVGVGVVGGAGDHIRRLAVSHTGTIGIVVDQTARPVIDHNVVRDPGIVAVLLTSSAKARVASNVASGTGPEEIAMFLVDDSNSHILRNRLTSNEESLTVGGTRNVVRANVITNSLGGIAVFDGSAATRVEFNRLSRVGDGVTVGVASGTVVAHNVVNRTGGDDTGGFGILLDGSVRSTVDRNIIRATGPGPGIYVTHLDAPTPPKDNRVIRNVTTSKNADGIFVDPDAAGTLLARNLAVRSGDDGIDVRAPGTTVTRNVAIANHDLGIAAVRGVIDGGGNREAGNGNPAQCINIVCTQP